MKFIFKIFFTTCILFSQSEAAEDFLPDSNFADGWKVSSKVINYTSSNLYGYINGGAELFLEFGFDSLIILNYQKGEEELSLEIYKMKTALAAYGVYLMKCGKEESSEEIAARHTVNRFQYLLLRNKYFVQVNNFSGSEDNLKAMTLLSQKFIKGIEAAKEPEIFNWLPQENRIAGSELIIRGQYGLQSIYTFGPQDILGLNGQHFALLADYKTEADGKYTRLRIGYPDAQTAAKVFADIKQNLDPLLKQVKSVESLLVFQDYKNEFGVIEKRDNFLDIKIHLKKY